MKSGSDCYRALRACRARKFVPLALALPMLLGGCGLWQMTSDAAKSAYQSVFVKQVKVLNIDLNARAAINLDAQGKPCSVAVRVYQLKTRKTFDAASYDDLLKKDQTALAQDLLGTMATVVNPGASASLSQPMQDETAYVAIVAFYQTPDSDGSWKLVVEKKQLDPDHPLTLDLVGQRLVNPAARIPRKPETDSPPPQTPNHPLSDDLSHA